MTLRVLVAAAAVLAALAGGIAARAGKSGSGFAMVAMTCGLVAVFDPLDGAPW